MASRRASRKSRKASRKASRRNRKSSRRCWSRRNNVMMGGQAPLNNTSMEAAGRMSLNQGREYEEIHANQHGGAAVSLAAAAPVGDTGMLDDSLRGFARVAALDGALNQIRGMSDQSGGGRRRKAARGGSKTLKKLRARLAKMLRKLTRRGSRRQRGGAALNPADYGSPGMLLSPADEARALSGMNPEWKLAADPSSFAPKLA